MSLLQNMHFPYNAILPSSTSTFSPMQSTFKRKKINSCSSDVDSTFMLFMFLYCFFYSAVSDLFLLFHTAHKSISSLSPSFSLTGSPPSFHAGILCSPSQFLFSFSYLCLYNTDVVLWLLNASPLIAVRVFNCFLLHFFAAPQVTWRGGEEFEFCK